MLAQSSELLRRLPQDGPEVQVVLPIMLRYRLAAPADPGEQTKTGSSS